MVNQKFLFAVLILFTLAIPFALGSYIRIYHESQGPNSDEAWPYGQFQNFETSGTVGQLPCAREGRYFMDVGVTGYQTESGVEYDAQGKSCNAITGDYSRIFNCYAYTINYDKNQTFCAQTPSCFRDSQGNEFNAVWDSVANNGKGACCGDDPAGLNPSGTSTTIDDPDMGKMSCDYCPVGLNNNSGTGSGKGLRFWSPLVPEADRCCGDDEEDCAQVRNNFLCWDFQGRYTSPTSASVDPLTGLPTDGSPGNYQGGQWYWTPASTMTAKILNVSCESISVVSNGNEWVGCTPQSFISQGLPGTELNCVLSLTEETNAHIGSCAENYPIEVACNVDCKVAAACGGYTEMMRLSDSSNAHGALPGYANYPVKVCCNVSGQTGTDGPLLVSLDLTGQGNGHASVSDPLYSNQIRFPSGVQCQVRERQVVKDEPGFHGKVFSQNPVSNPYNIAGHEYYCFYQDSPKIAECCGGTKLNPQGTCNSTLSVSGVKKSYGGVRKTVGQKVTQSLNGKDTSLYCTSDFKWRSDLDSSDAFTCTSAGLTWTNHYCCGEADELQEFYNDVGGPGICFNNTFKKNGTFMFGKNLYITNGTAQGCAIGRDNYNATNNWLLSLRDYPDSNENLNANVSKPLLVNDNDWCAQVASKKYFCSFKEKWVSGENRTQLSTVPVSWPVPPTAQRSECCKELECWNTTACVASYHTDASKKPVLADGKEWRCIFGEWTTGGLKYNWNREFSGYCQFDNQCLVDPLGSYNHNNMPGWYSADAHESNPQCINNSQFIGDHYCENGNWTTRTKFVLQKLVANAGSEYTIFCDNYQFSLNYYDYSSLPNGFTYKGNYDCTDLGQDEGQIYKVYFGSERRCPTNCTTGGIETDCANNVCVLVKGNQVVLGVSLNQDANSSFYPFLDLLNLSKCNSGGVLQDGYRKCDSSGKVWYNNKLRTIIFSKGPVDISSSLWSQLKDWITSLISNFKIRNDEQYNFVTKNPQLKRVFMDNHGTKSIAAFIEEDVFDEGVPQTYLSARYSGFGANICAAFNASYNMKNPDSEYICTKTSNVYEIRAQTGSPIFGIWKDYTAKLRVKS